MTPVVVRFTSFEYPAGPAHSVLLNRFVDDAGEQYNLNGDPSPHRLPIVPDPPDWSEFLHRYRQTRQ